MGYVEGEIEGGARLCDAREMVLTASRLVTPPVGGCFGVRKGEVRPGKLVFEVKLGWIYWDRVNVQNMKFFISGAESAHQLKNCT